MQTETLSATDLAAAFAAGTLSPVDAARDLVERIGAVDGHVNAVLIVSPTALADAAESAARRQDGRARSPLDGVPVLLKDNVDTVDLPTTAGSRLPLGARPVRDAALVTTLRAAGLVVLGKTNLSEWSNFRSTESISGWSGVGGQTHNPHVLDRNTSGSSAGSAAAVAAGYAPLAVGTETNGSILSPAAHCGIVGFKPTVGVVPGAGIVPITTVQDTAGPLTRTVADAALFLDALAGRPVSAGPALPAHPTLSFWRPEHPAAADGPAGGAGGDAGSTAVDSALAAGTRLALDHFDRCLDALADAGVDLVPVSAPPDDEELGEAGLMVMLAEYRRDLTAYLRARPGGPQSFEELIAGDEADALELSVFGHEFFLQALAGPAADDDAVRAARARLTESGLGWLRAVVGAGAPAGSGGAPPLAVLSPTCGPTMPIGHLGERGFATYSVAAVVGACSASVPVGAVGRSGVLPVGLALAGLPGADAGLLAVAALVEATVGRVLAPRFLPTLDGD